MQDTVVDRLATAYHDAFTVWLDPRSEDWLLCRSLLVPLAIMASYLYFVKRCGPQFMAHRKPYDVKNAMIAYNMLQIVINVYVCTQASITWFGKLQRFACQPIDFSVNETTTHMANLVWMYYVLKIIDLVDTVFFLLRKKEKQATFLHVYHHCTMILAGYLACRFALNGHLFLLGILNTLVHTVLYSYYLLAAIRPETRQATWKKYITILQLIQFAVLGVHNALPLLVHNCEIQKVWCALLVAQSIFMFLMFSDFYVKAYGRAKKRD